MKLKFPKSWLKFTPIFSEGKKHTKDEWHSIHQQIALISTKEDLKIIESIITKDFTIGLAVKSYNKVASKVSQPEIPFYDTMRVSSITDAKINYEKGAYVGIKKDGANATVERSAMLMSRNGQVIMLPHLEEILIEISKKVTLFGELVSTTRQSSSGLVNSAIKLGYQSKLPLHELALHVFDAMSIEEYESRQFKTPFKDRIKLAEKTVIEINHPMIQFVEQKIVYSKEEALEIYAIAISVGEEGIIINDADQIFEIGRSKLRARIKAEETADVRIIAVTPHNKKPNMVGSVTVTSEDGVISDVGSGLTEEMMKEFHVNSPVGKIMEIKYNMVIPNQTGDGWTFFLPTVGKNKIRFDKDEADCVLKKSASSK